MNELKDILIKYVGLRRKGLKTKAALNKLRPAIEPLDKSKQKHLLDQVRALEVRNRQKRAVPTQVASEPTRPLKQLASIQKIGVPSFDDDATIPRRPDTQDQNKEAWIICPQCKKQNRKGEVFCYACGSFLERGLTQHDTRHIADSEDGISQENFFGEDYAMVLELQPSGPSHKIRPARYDHEIVIGRRTSNSAIQPDIDLSRYDAANKGVSRLHLAINYSPKDNILQVYDMGSTNGSFVNGERLHPREVRILRHGDEMRLGELAIRAYFRPPNKRVTQPMPKITR